MTEPLVIHMQNIRKTFPGSVALNGVDLTLHRGEVLGLVGANGAGKSTLMNVLSGVLAPDDGSIEINGQIATIKNPKDTQSLGVAFVQQEVATFPNLSVLDNLFMPHFPAGKILLRRKEMRRRAMVVLRRLGCSFSLDEEVNELSTGDRQMVTIARALLAEPQVIILDEPTSSLSGPEKKQLFAIIRSLQAEGVSFIYISHFLEEILEISNRITVMRNGEVVSNVGTDGLTHERIVEWMMGKAIPVPTKLGHKELGKPILEVRDLTRDGVLEAVTLSVRSGEVVGLWGLMGSGRTELARAIIGIDPVDAGSVSVDIGTGLAKISRAARQKHIGLVPEDRRGEGVFLPLSVKANIALGSLSRLRRFGLMSKKMEAALAQRYISELGIKVASSSQVIGTLSGGNQQKAVVARSAALAPKLFILDEPMRGLDVNAKAQMRALIAKMAEGGTGVLVIDSEMDELRLVADRFVVLHRGRVSGECRSDVADSVLMGLAMAGSGVK